MYINAPACILKDNNGKLNDWEIVIVGTCHIHLRSALNPATCHVSLAVHLTFTLSHTIMNL